MNKYKLILLRLKFRAIARWTSSLRSRFGGVGWRLVSLRHRSARSSEAMTRSHIARAATAEFRWDSTAKGKWSFIWLVLITLVLVGAGCSFKTASRTADGGVYRSDDLGKTWQQKVFAGQQNNKNVTIASLDIRDLQFSAADPGVLAAVAGDKGLLITSDGGEQWRQIYQQPTTAVAIHPTAKDTFYIAAGNRIYRTTDSGQNWQTVYLDTTPDAQITAVATNRANDKQILAASSRGILLQSLDSGNSWEQLYLFKAAIAKILFNQVNGKLIFVAQTDGRLWRSYDSGVSWTDLSNTIKQLNPRRGSYQAMTFVADTANILYATQNGLMLGSEAGEKWSNLKLVTAPGAVALVSLAVHPKLPNNIFYTTATGFYRSTDKGETWQTSSLPSSRLPSSMAINPSANNQIYLGFTRK